MKESSDRIRRAVLWSASGALTAALIVAGSAAQAAHVQRTDPAKQATQAGPGYPAPKGIYKPFTDCPIVNPLMQESLPNQVTGCVTGEVIAGKIKIGNITTKIRATAKVKIPVAVQFGLWDPPNAGDNQFTGGVLPPPDGLANQSDLLPPAHPRRAERSARLPEHQQDRSEAVQRDPEQREEPAALCLGRIRWSDHQLPGCHLDPADHVPPDQPVARPELFRRLG